MDNDANRLIDSLFSRINQAEQQSGSRDAAAESQINKHLIAQPAAPYYMAQTIIMQEAALKQLKAKVEALEQQQSQSAPASGGFLAGLFGGGHSQSQNTPQPQAASSWSQAGSGPQPGNNAYSQPQQPAASGWGQRAPSFLGGALQTAAGVAGGVVIGDMLMNMFSHHNPTEIVDIIDERPASDPSAANNLGSNDAATDPGNSGFDNSSDGFQNQDNGVGQDNGFGNDDYGNDNFGGFDDDDSFF